MDSTSLTAVSKIVQEDPLSDAVLRYNNFTMMLDVMPNMSNNGRDVPIRIANPPGIGANDAGLTVAQAIAADRGSTVRKFTITHQTLHGVARLSGNEVLGSQSRIQAYADLVKLERDGVGSQLGKTLEHFFFGNGWGAFGTVGSFTGAALTLAAGSDVFFPDRGQKVVAAAAETTGNIRSESTNGSVIDGVDRSTGIITFTADVDDGTDGISTAVAAGDTLFLKGIRQESSSPTKQVTDGLKSWLPGTDPGSSDSHFGVNRGGDTNLFGFHVDAVTSGLDWLTTLIDMERLACTNEGVMDLVLCSPLNYRNIKLELHSNVDYTEKSFVEGNISFKLLEYPGQNGQMVRIVPSRGCPDNRLFGLESDSWYVASMRDELVGVFDIDGNEWLRTTGDSVEIRMDARLQLVCNAPGHNCVATVSA